MPASNKKITPFHYTVVIVWLVATFIGASYFISIRLAPFDSAEHLRGQTTQQLLQKIQKLPALKGAELVQTIIHFSSDNCHCTQFSEDHKKDIDKLARSLGFQILHIKLSESDANTIPSTPSIAIINNQQNLIYFGPYSTGLACSESNGYVELVLENYRKGYSSKLIVTDTQGCYCQL